MSEHLETLVKTYTDNFGFTDHPIIWDVGSRDGDDGVELAHKIIDGGDVWRRSEINLVEANPVMQDHIAQWWPRAILHRTAVSDEVGTAPFIVFKGGRGDVGSSSLRLNWKDGELTGTVIEVPVNRLENLIHTSLIDIMKIDCEGKSLEVLRGMGDKLNRVKVYHIETENHEPERQTKLKLFMQANGYTLTAVDHEYSHLDDYIYIKGEKDAKSY